MKKQNLKKGYNWLVGVVALLGIVCNMLTLDDIHTLPTANRSIAKPTFFVDLHISSKI